MECKNRIEVNPDVLAGKPVIKGTRISVELILDRLANGWSMEDILSTYPHLMREDVLAAIRSRRSDHDTFKRASFCHLHS